MSDLDNQPAPPVQQHVAKPRRCLMCGAAFDSAWAGERICRQCKAGDIYGRVTALPENLV